ncbi:NHL repeat-containing protein [Mesorhizobium sp. VK9D]|uniref:NHL repeat-containing protein n=1 Tax=Mesorhizobium australafricanum TaxID=3072311 RepID=UPI002A2413CE|nr:NHL repeat-containing protein [Mesorhizobium sp. VK9D]MDX8456566.1 NHL repeat-containing protein [Mesorhizobium sp. VK9D]
MAGLAVSDLRRGISILQANPSDPPADVPAPAGFGLPYGLARLPDGRLLTADRSQSRIIACAEDGTNWESFGSQGAGVGQFQNPMGVAVSDEGRIFVADTGNFRIVAIDAFDGTGWQAYGQKIATGSVGPGRFAGPICIQHGPGGLVVADPAAARIVQLAQLDDAHWDVSSQGTFRNPTAVAVLPDGTIIVGDLTREGLSIMASPSGGITETILGDVLRYPAALAVTGADALAAFFLPTLALCSVVRDASGWNVSLDARLDQVVIRRPTALCQLP